MDTLGYYLPCLYACAACLGFCVLFNIHGLGMLVCALGGGLGWLAYLLCAGPSGGNEMIQSLVAAIVISAYAEVMARIRKCPVTPYLLIACLPLVPGAGIYYTMEYAISGDTQGFLSAFIHTLGLAGSMALGILLVGSAVRLSAGYRRGRSTPRRRQ